MQSELDPTDILTILQHGNQLKRTVRTGWVQRGVPSPENVAAHSYGMAYTALILTQWITEPLDMGKTLAMALLHDLPEGLTSDIPSPAWRFLPPGIKLEAEQQAIRQILNRVSFALNLLELWEEFVEAKTAEARLVHDADRLDMYLQAANYEEETGNRKLGEFWAKEPAFHFAASRAVFNAIKQRAGRK